MQRITVLILALLAASGSALAQKYTGEVSPFVGYQSHRTFQAGANTLEFKDIHIWGVRAGVVQDGKYAVEGTFAYLPHYEFVGRDPKIRGLLYEGNYLVQLPTPYKFKPFATIGLGGISSVNEVAQPPLNTKVLASRLTMNFGGGVKAERLWGPLGGRFDIRGRTIFNVADKNPTGLEVSGGLILSWGPR
ncbi:MAG: hypothetical protein ACR2L2_10580 [Acidobacteriota bacterium]